MIVTRVSPGQATQQMQARAKEAGAQFEAILLNTVFGDLERSFTQLPGGSEDAISKSYDGFGMEAISSGLARSGGAGLGAFIAKALLARANDHKVGV
ncbi:MAG TPA: hypothetical protein VJO35_16235 [Terriglobales bacterium]|nr:hypothetical protein [Terriglobales bacterium]